MKFMLFMLLSSVLGVVQASSLDGSFHYHPSQALQTSWVFSGVVEDETGEQYGYFFQADKDNSSLHVLTALFDRQTKSVILQEEGRGLVPQDAPLDWHIGDAFLRFNAINNSWIFGFQTKDKKGFNFKVDMLKGQEHLPLTENLKPGVNFLVSQTGQLNGHIQWDPKRESFVTAKNAWFREVWLTEKARQDTIFSGVLCHFTNGSGFYSVHLPTTRSAKATEAGWYDASGIPSAISRFIHITQSPEDGPWHIRLDSPNLHLILSDYLKQDTAIAGFIVESKNPGFCLLSQNEFKGFTETETIAG